MPDRAPSALRARERSSRPRARRVPAAWTTRRGTCARERPQCFARRPSAQRRVVVVSAVVTEPGSRYLTFDREEWAALRAATPLTLRESDLESLRGINDRIDLDEVTAVYLPLTRLLNLYVSATQN